MGEIASAIAATESNFVVKELDACFILQLHSPGLDARIWKRASFPGSAVGILTRAA